MLHARRRKWFASGVSGALTAAVIFALVAGPTVLSGSAAHAADSSTVTVTAKDQDPESYVDAPFPDLSVTVSQTKDLQQQGVTVSWTGATGNRSQPPTSGSGGSWFLQVFQCWGDDPKDSTRPDRTTCQYGGVTKPGATRDASRGTYEYDQIPIEDQPYSAPRVSSFESGYTSIPFRARNGKVVSSITTVDGTSVRDSAVDVNNNEFFSVNTTNEVPWAGSGPDGTGALSFELQTTMQSPGLGCGDPVDVAGTVRGASCWLVILPRPASDNGSPTINQSGLFWESWQHALAVRMDFAPIGARCTVGAAERQLAGSEVVSLAVLSWQPTLCTKPGGAVYSHLTIAEEDALTAANTTEDAPLALTTYPVRDATTSLTYAPIALSGIAISFAIDRNPDPINPVPPEYADAVTLPFEELRLTPRLLAKLLTNSYWGSLPAGADISYLDPDNPENITEDPDFLAVNAPEWGYQLLRSAAIADVLMPQGRSDSARAVWTYVMSDPDAAAFMAGEPDPYGITVNPWYTTDASKNKSGSALELPRDNFPKADPAEATFENQGPINVVTLRPYVNDLDAAAYFTLRGDGQVLGQWDPNAAPAKYGKTGRVQLGFQKVIGLTDTAASARYQVRVASLRNSAGEFVAPTEPALLAAAATMQPVGEDGVIRAFDSTAPAAKNSPAAYPLTVPVYAAARRSLLSDQLRTDYASFIRYAATDGQVSGVSLGELPAGYAPIPEDWAAQSLAAADFIQNGPTPTPSPTQAGNAPYVPPPKASQPVPNQGAAPPVAPPVAAPPATPEASGSPSTALSGGTTPLDPDAGAIAVAVPASVLGGIAGAAAVPLITRLRRRVT